MQQQRNITGSQEGISFTIIDLQKEKMSKLPLGNFLEKCGLTAESDIYFIENTRIIIWPMHKKDLFRVDICFLLNSLRRAKSK